MYIPPVTSLVAAVVGASGYAGGELVRLLLGHPDLAVGWGQCTVSYTTHAIGGLSENDFICAAKTDLLLLSQAV